ncbi:hypothetical protein BDZ89DRAFT_1056190 [Hymenopellis radicata]|nr:hypothetical protein BDZ89DRAFT_1056190 [Hymenopellis radicata]
MSENVRDSPHSTRPLDVRRSRGSQSFNSQASTRSWVLQSQQNPPPPPIEPISGLPSPVEGDVSRNGLGLHVVNKTPKPKRRFVGGFVTNVKRAFRRREPRQPHACRAPFHLTVNQIPEALASGDVQRRRQEARLRPHGPRVVESYAPSPTEIPIDYTRDSALPQPASRPYSRPASVLPPPPTGFHRPQPSRPYSRPASVPPPPLPVLSPHPSQRQGSTLLSPHPSRHSHVSPSPPSAGDGHSHPASYQAHPPLAEDYRRMSFSKQAGTSSGGSGSEPSFATELNPIHRFFSTLYDMPWIASERVTSDYLPGLKRGAWTWKWATKEGREDRVLVHVPVRKPMRPWYTGKDKNIAVQGSTQVKLRDSKQADTSWASPGGNPVDLLSSGESATPPLSIVSGSATTASRRRNQRHRRSFVIFPDTEISHRRIPPPRTSRRHTHTTNGHHKRHNKPRSQPMYPHGYIPAPTPPTSKRTASPVPTMTPAFYVMGHPPPPQPAGSPTTPPPQGPFPYLTPVYMQMLPPAALSDVSSSPGLAGRGAGYSSMAMPVSLPAQNH